MRGEEIEIERNQRIAGAHVFPDGNARPKAFAFQGHGIDADVQQYISAFRRAQADGVTSRVQRNHFAIAWRYKCSVDGINREPIADHLLGEDRVHFYTLRGLPALMRKLSPQILHVHHSGNSEPPIDQPEAVKGIPYFLGAARQVLDVRSHVEFLVAGAGPEEANLRRVTRELGITEKVTFQIQANMLNVFNQQYRGTIDPIVDDGQFSATTGSTGSFANNFTDSTHGQRRRMIIGGKIIF